MQIPAIFTLSMIILLGEKVIQLQACSQGTSQNIGVQDPFDLVVFTNPARVPQLL